MVRMLTYSVGWILTSSCELFVQFLEYVYFCWALISLFYVFLVTFHFLLAFYSAFCSSLILT